MTGPLVEAAAELLDFFKMQEWPARALDRDEWSWARRQLDPWRFGMVTGHHLCEYDREEVMTKFTAVLVAALVTTGLYGARSRRFSDVPTPAAQAAHPRIFPGVQPQLAKLGDRMFLAYGQDNVISVLSSPDGGQPFGQPVKLTVPGRVLLGMHRGPRIAATNSAVMVAVAAAPTRPGVDGDLLLYRSLDRGATWAKPVVVNDVRASAREGLHALTATPGGLVVIAWLDLREQGTRIYTTVSRDHGATWSSDRLAYASPSGGVCQCCHPSVALGRSGSMAVMFRNNLSGNRDLYVTRSRDGVTFSPAEKSGAGSWKLDACPMDGGAVMFDGDDVVAVWRREEDIYLNTLGTPEQRIGTGRDPVVALAGAHRDIAWSSPSGMVLVRDGGAPMPLGAGRFPALLSFERRTIVAWEFQETVKVLSIPR